MKFLCLKINERRKHRLKKESNILTAEELRSMDIKLRGYAMPDDNAPCFYKRCKLYEALDIMREYMDGVSEEFYNFAFTLTDENDEFLFQVCREFDTVYFGRVNIYNLTEDIAKEALGMK